MLGLLQLLPLLIRLDDRPRIFLWTPGWSELNSSFVDLRSIRNAKTQIQTLQCASFRFAALLLIIEWRWWILSSVMKCERWIIQLERSVGQRKHLRLRQESNRWPPEYTWRTLFPLSHENSRTTTYLVVMSSRSSVDRAPSLCSGGHGFDSCWGLRYFLCPTFVLCWITHLLDCFSYTSQRYDQQIYHDVESSRTALSDYPVFYNSRFLLCLQANFRLCLYHYSDL